MRCPDCRELGLECQRGYFTGLMRCDVCHYGFVLSAPMCAPIDDVKCPECEGTIECVEEEKP